MNSRPALNQSDQALPLLTEPSHSKPFYKHIYFWVLLGVVLGVLFGVLFPSQNGQPGLAEKLKPLGEGFIALIKMLIAPIIFLTVVGGIVSVDNGLATLIIAKSEGELDLDLQAAKPVLR